MSQQSGQSVGEREVVVVAEGVELPGTLGMPPGDPIGAVIFCHGSGSSRHSSRNRFVAERLRGRGLATLLFDLLTEDEGEDRRLVFDIATLADRTRGAADWAGEQGVLRGVRLGLFGASTGAAAALVAAARGADVHAVVSRGGRPDLAGDALGVVRAPTLLLVGGRDQACIPLNQMAYEMLRCEKDLDIVPGATHLFEEPGTLERVAELAGDWFARFLPGRAHERGGRG